MGKKKRKAKGSARTTVVLSKNEQDIIANLIRYHIQDNGINPVSDTDLDNLEKYIKNLFLVELIKENDNV